jgi:alpha-1,2-mannosyltransferase
LHKYYSAPAAIYTVLSTQQQPDEKVCTCGEWYRFPSSFYLPTGQDLGFLPSSFTGQLPQPFSVHGSKPASVSVQQPFNDRNLEQKERYVDVADCHWIVDLSTGDCAPASARVVATAPFLDAERTPSTLHRTLYLPFWHEKAVKNGQVHYQDYVLYNLN